MSSLFRRASKLVKQVSGSEKETDGSNPTDVGSVAKKGLFSPFSASKNKLPMNDPAEKTGTPSPSLMRTSLLRGNTISKDKEKELREKEREKEREREREKEREQTLANATSALTASRKVRSEHNLAEENDSSQEHIKELPTGPIYIKKDALKRSNTVGKQSKVFNSLDAKDPPMPISRPSTKTLSVTKDPNAFTGRTSVTNLNKNNPSNMSMAHTGAGVGLGGGGINNGSTFNITDPPPPLPFLTTTEIPVPKIPEPALPKIATLKVRAATEQPMSGAKSTNQLFGGTGGGGGGGLGGGPSSALGGSSIDLKYKNALQQGSPSQNQLLMAGNTGNHAGLGPHGNHLLLGSAAAARQEKRNAGLSAYEISAPATTPSLKRYCLDDFHIVRRVGRG
ncbi:UNVERIFIED_CONTAM: hypothetical protein HDU68_006464, partial [Siphonaria sp. JEL0065]